MQYFSFATGFPCAHGALGWFCRVRQQIGILTFGPNLSSSFVINAAPRKTIVSRDCNIMLPGEIDCDKKTGRFPSARQRNVRAGRTWSQRISLAKPLYTKKKRRARDFIAAVLV
jgi:hypothetical protein